MVEAVGGSRRLVWLGAASVACYAGILGLSFEFAPQAPAATALRTLGLFGLATLAYFLALALLLRQRQDTPGRLRTILLFALGYRLLLLPSAPIQEIDYYRYLWDGRATLSGFNPYHYSPEQIEHEGPLAADGTELAGLWQTANQSEPVKAIFDGVHYRGVPTAYPPLAQGVFAFSALLTPADAPLAVHIFIWKAILLLFDMGTIGLLALLLRRLRLPAAWCLAYAWCPLALKEFANSGHFDAIAIFFTVLAAYWLVRGMSESDQTLEVTRNRKRGWLRLPFGQANDLASEGDDACGFASTGSHRSLCLASLALTALALAVLAKSYPVILLPVVLAFLLARIGWRTVLPAASFIIVLVMGYLPFTILDPRSSILDPQSSTLAPPASHAGSGLGAFLTQWEMNDFLFMLVQENLRQPSGQPDAWFVLTPPPWRAALHERLVELLGAQDISAQVNPAFLLTQLLMGLLLAGLCLFWAARTYRRPEAEQILRGLFLSLAWAWLLASAANPWYLLWSLPFMVFARRRSWFLLPGLAFLYYARPLLELNGGFDRFDYGLVWLEYAPFFAALLVESMSRGCRDSTPGGASASSLGGFASAGPFQALPTGATRVAP